MRNTIFVLAVLVLIAGCQTTVDSSQSGHPESFRLTLKALSPVYFDRLEKQENAIGYQLSDDDARTFLQTAAAETTR